MKLNRLMLAGLLVVSLSATSAYACDGKDDHKSEGGWFSSFWHHCDHDHDGGGQNSNGGHQCNGGGSNSGGSSSSGSGSSSGGSGSTSGGGTVYK
jgi:hypothetical protein